MPSPKLSKALQGKVVLIIDDEPAIRRLVAREFIKHGCTILEAPDAKSAEIYFTHSFADVIICDERMPGGGGSDLIKSIGPETSKRGTIIVMLSGYTDISEADARKYGVLGIFRKPVSMKELSGFVVDCVKE